MDQYHALYSMKEDLLGEQSTRFFAKVTLPVQLASFAFADAKDGDGGKDPKDTKDDKDKPCGAGAETSEKKKGEGDMKEDDVTAGLAIATKLQEAGMIAEGKYNATVLFLAKMTPESRAEWAGMVGNMNVGVGGEPVVPITPFNTNMVGASVAETNMVVTGVQKAVGGTQRAGRPGMIGLFTNSVRSPIFG